MDDLPDQISICNSFFVEPIVKTNFPSQKLLFLETILDEYQLLA